MSEISVDKPDPTDSLGIDNPASVNSELAFDDVRVPDEFRLPEVASMPGPRSWRTLVALHT